MGSDPKPPKTDKVPRSEVHEKLLEEALRTPEEEVESYESGKWIAESPAPDELPRFIRARLDQAGIKDVERYVERLMAAGCETKVKDSAASTWANHRRGRRDDRRLRCALSSA